MVAFLGVFDVPRFSSILVSRHEARGLVLNFAISIQNFPWDRGYLHLAAPEVRYNPVLCGGPPQFPQRRTGVAE
jgi:hypothetical protein